MRLLSFLSIMPLAFSLFIAFSQAAFAQNTPQPVEISAVYACKSLAEPMARLECYDNAVGRLQQAEESGEVVTVSKKEVEKVERDAFGFNIPSLPGLGKLFKKDKSKKKQAAITDSPPNATGGDEREFNASDMKAVNLQIKKIDEFGYGKIRFFFTNGQVWEQTRKERINIPKVRGGNPNTAEISKASLGSFLLQVNGKGTKTRVRRVR